jgi:phosphohistidine swiveling domain-containing protein
LISSWDQLLAAKVQILEQDDLEEYILQVQMNYAYHLTAYSIDDFFFIQIKPLNLNTYSFLVITQNTVTGQHPYQNELIQFYRDWKKLNLPDNVHRIIELGLSPNEIKLFQVMQVKPEIAGQVIKTEYFLPLLQGHLKSKNKPSFLGQISQEFRAFLFRKKIQKEIFSIKKSFKNWEFIFHYFKLFCILRHKTGSEADFAHFLNWAQDPTSSWPAAAVKEHIQISCYDYNRGDWSDSSTTFTSSLFSNSEGPYFFPGHKMKGKIVSGEISKLIELHKELTPQIIYQGLHKSVLMTQSKDLLGHSILAAIENDIPVVTHINDLDWEKLIHSKKITIDFNQNKIDIY